MKQMRSRFRLIALLLACAFLLVLVLCTGSVLKEAGITLSSLSSVRIPGVSASPDPSVSPEPFSSPDAAPETPAPNLTPSPDDFPETDISPDPEYNVFGL